MARAFGLAVAAILLGLMAYSAGLAVFVGAWAAALGIAYIIGIVVSNEWGWPIEMAGEILRDIFGR
jgi:hypothetical protein